MQKNRFSTLVSVRLDNNILSLIDDYAAQSKYRTRNNIINRLLTRAISHLGKERLWELIETNNRVVV